LGTFSDYGVSSDEPGHHLYGMRVLRYYESGGADRSFEHYFEYHRLAGEALYDVTVALLERVSPLPRYATRHLAGAACGLIGLAGCWRLTVLVAGAAAALWAMLLLALTPGWWGHMFFNAKDIPFATAHIWALVQLIRLRPDPARAPWRTVLGFATAAGVAMGVRAGGIFLLGYLGVVLAIAVAGSPDRRTGPALARFAAAAGIAWAIMLVSWPWAQGAPVARPLAALHDVERFPHPTLLRFRGAMLLNTALPRSYVPVYAGVTLPELYFPALLAAAVAGAAGVRRRGSWRGAGGVIPSALLVTAAVAVPVVSAIAGSAMLYNGLRHLTFVLPPLACLAGAGLEAARQWLGRRARVVRWIAGGAAGAWLAWHVGILVRLHPYEYLYYNAATGGLRGAADRYELDYWGLANREAYEGLVALTHAAPAPGGRAWRVLSCSDILPAFTYMPPGLLEPSPRPAQAEFVVGNTSQGNDCDTAYRGRVVVEVQRFGVPLARVKDVRRGTP
jgi:hypothetical protein